MSFIIANEAFERVASVGLRANMILYLRNEYHLSSATGASILFLWGAISNFKPTLGAFLSDSYFGRFRVIALGSIISLIRYFQQQGRLVVMQVLRSVPNQDQIALLFLSFAVMSIGSGGIRPCSSAFGADQFDRPENPENTKILQRFFNWYYASVGISVMVSVTVIVYIQTAKGWILGFGVPAGLMLFSTVMFCVGSSLYIKVKANKSLITGHFQVVAASCKNKHFAFPAKNPDGWLHHKKGSKILVPTDKLRLLNKACIRLGGCRPMEPVQRHPNMVCRHSDRSDRKPTLLPSAPSQHHGHRRVIGSFKIPPGSFDVFTLLTLTIWVALYDQLLVHHISKLTKRPEGLGLKQRMGIGQLLSCLTMAVSTLVERKRHHTAIDQRLSGNSNGVVNMSAFWLVPQYCLIGLAEAFNAIGQIEFSYSQFPKSMASIGVALFALGMAIGNLVGSLIVGVVNEYSKQDGFQQFEPRSL